MEGIGKAIEGIAIQISLITEAEIWKMAGMLGEVKDTDEMVGVIVDRETRRAYCLLRKQMTELRIVIVQAADDFLDEETKARLEIRRDQLNESVDLLKEWFWFSVKVELGNFGDPISLRKDFAVVKAPESKPDLPDRLREILEGLGWEQA